MLPYKTLATLDVAILILAAGSSSRLGQPKQLVKRNGTTLLQNTIKTALAVNTQPVVVMLGAYAEKIKPTIGQLPIVIVENENWETGMGATIAKGMDFIKNNCLTCKAAIILVSDQYHLSEHVLYQLIEKWEKTGSGIIASKYGKMFGVPALFSKNLFAELMDLEGKAGAKKIIAQHLESASFIDFEKGTFDLDTEEDLEKMDGKSMLGI